MFNQMVVHDVTLKKKMDVYYYFQNWSVLQVVHLRQ